MVWPMSIPPLPCIIISILHKADHGLVHKAYHGLVHNHKAHHGLVHKADHGLGPATAKFPPEQELAMRKHCVSFSAFEARAS